MPSRTARKRSAAQGCIGGTSFGLKLRPYPAALTQTPERSGVRAGGGANRPGANGRAAAPPQTPERAGVRAGVWANTTDEDASAAAATERIKPNRRPPILRRSFLR